MGLDMYLEKYPRNFEVRTVKAVEEFYSWVKEGLEDGLECSFKDWCGISVNDLPNIDTLIKMLPMIHTTYCAWDDQKEYPNKYIHEEVGYWRKANAIHGWFVENIQDGKDDCCYHHPVTRDDLETLFELCREVLADHSKANDLLPVISGFFFVSRQYDEWYFKGIQYTADLCEQLIRDFDFENYDLYYRSSW